MNIPSDYPKKLYKYRTFDKDGYYKNLIKNNELFFSSPDKFNDPFDCCVYVEFNERVKQQSLDYFEQYFRKEHSNIPSNIMDRNIQLVRGMKEELFKSQLMQAQFFRGSAIQNGICSLSSKKDSILMWSHYSENHKGFCLELDVNIIIKTIERDFQDKDNALALGKVSYILAYPILNNVNNPMEYIKIYFQKHPDWTYEAEWRLLHLNHPNQCIRFPEGIITAIYFGEQCLKSDIDIIWELVKDKEHRPKFYKASKALSSFELEFREINWYR
jgi:hypothetical protein